MLDFGRGNGLYAAECGIVIEETAPSTVRFAAREMKEALDGVFGADVPVVHALTPGKRHLVLGENAWTRAEGLAPSKLPRDAFEIKVTPEGPTSPESMIRRPTSTAVRFTAAHSARRRMASMSQGG